MENVNFAKNKKCHDCGKELKIIGEEIRDGFLLEYENAGEKMEVFKCKDCFDKNPSLSNFQKCEVYSRVCGYIRPVSQWNIGKKREYAERKEFREEN